MSCELDLARDFPACEAVSDALASTFASLPGSWVVSLRRARFVPGAWNLTVSTSGSGPMASALLEAQTDAEEVCTLASWLAASISREH